MWKITLFCNILIISLLWLLSQIAITPVSNLLVQYAETAGSLPILTDFAIQNATLSSAIPIGWGILTVFWAWKVRDKTEQKRNEWISVHTSVTLCIGLVVLLFFSLAGILPILKIGPAVF